MGLREAQHHAGRSSRRLKVASCGRRCEWAVIKSPVAYTWLQGGDYTTSQEQNTTMKDKYTDPQHGQGERPSLLAQKVHGARDQSDVRVKQRCGRHASATALSQQCLLLQIKESAGEARPKGHPTGPMHDVGRHDRQQRQQHTLACTAGHTQHSTSTPTPQQLPVQQEHTIHSHRWWHHRRMPALSWPTACPPPLKHTYITLAHNTRPRQPPVLQVHKGPARKRHTPCSCSVLQQQQRTQQRNATACMPQPGAHQLAQVLQTFCSGAHAGCVPRAGTPEPPATGCVGCALNTAHQYAAPRHMLC